MREVCAYGDCTNMMSFGKDRLTITMSSKGKLTVRKAFCCMEHATKWLQEQTIFGVPVFATGDGK